MSACGFAVAHLAQRYPDRMHDRPSSRRWFQFHLSTWFVLVAICAWAMTCRPYWVRHTTEMYSRFDYLLGEPTPNWAQQELQTRPHLSGIGKWAWRPNGRFIWPALALAAFLTWKAAWTIRSAQFTKSRAPF